MTCFKHLIIDLFDFGLHVIECNLHFLFLFRAHLRHMEVSKLEVKSELQLPPTPRPQEHRIRAMPVTYTTAHSSARSRTHWARPGIGTLILMDTSQICFHCVPMGTPCNLHFWPLKWIYILDFFFVKEHCFWKFLDCYLAVTLSHGYQCQANIC